MSRTLKLISSVIAIILVAAIVAGVIVLVISGGDPLGYAQMTLLRIQLSNRQSDLLMPVGTDSTPVRFSVSPGESTGQIAQNLYSLNLIRDPELFVNYARLEGLDRQLEAGTYFVNQTQTIPTIAHLLTDSRNASIPFRVLEGSRIEEVAASIDANGLFGFSGADFLAVVGPNAQIDPQISTMIGLPPGASLEGYLFPDTYILPPEITPQGLRDTLVEAFLQAVGQQWIADAAAQGLSVHDAVTLASIVEREAVWPDENPMIASVYRNRMSIGMRLEADPTVQYGLNGSRGTWWPDITLADYRSVSSPYNTYLIDTLPPGPIASPALSALQAAVYPAQSIYFFFRAACDGSNYHNFTTTYEEHLANGC